MAHVKDELDQPTSTSCGLGVASVRFDAAESLGRFPTELSQDNSMRTYFYRIAKLCPRAMCLGVRRNKAVAHLDVETIQNEDQVILEWPRIEEVDASLKALADLANAFEQVSGLPIMFYELAENWSGSEAVVNHLTNSIRLKQLVKDGILSRELAYPSRFCSKNSQATR